MEQSEKTLLGSITKLMEQLQSKEQKLDKFSGELGAVRTKVDLAMTSSPSSNKSKFKLLSSSRWLQV
jgi:hypothetical protein